MNEPKLEIHKRPKYFTSTLVGEVNVLAPEAQNIFQLNLFVIGVI